MPSYTATRFAAGTKLLDGRKPRAAANRRALPRAIHAIVGRIPRNSGDRPYGAPKVSNGDLIQGEQPLEFSDLMKKTNGLLDSAGGAMQNVSSASEDLKSISKEDFNTEYREARRTAFLQSIARLQQVSSAAASLMMKMLADPNAPAAVRVRAADSVLKHSRYGMEIEDIDARLRDLERSQSDVGEICAARLLDQ